MTAALKFLGIRGLVGLAVSALLAGLLVIQTHKTHNARADAVRWEQQYNDEHAAFVGTVANYRAAAERAHQADIENLQRVRAEQSAINERTEHDYEARIAAARARADSLRQQAAPTGHPGSPDAAPVSTPRGPSRGLDGSASEAGLSPDDQLIATEQAIQLDELIKWVRANLAVDLGTTQSAPTPPSGQTGSR